MDCGGCHFCFNMLKFGDKAMLCEMNNVELQTG